MAFVAIEKNGASLIKGFSCATKTPARASHLFAERVCQALWGELVNGARVD